MLKGYMVRERMGTPGSSWYKFFQRHLFFILANHAAIDVFLACTNKYTFF